MTKTYVCDECGETYEAGWSDEEAIAEMKKEFGDIPKEDRAIVCDHCYNQLMKEIKGVH